MKTIVSAVLLLFLSGITAFGQVDMVKLVEKDTFILKVKNELPTIIRLIINDSKTDNIIFLYDTAYSEVLRIPLTAEQDTSELLADYSFAVRIGDGKADHDDNYKYSLPYPTGRSYEVIQGFKGKFSHNKLRSRFAVDFRMPEGDTVCAAREGLVVWTEDHHDEGGNDPALIDEANRVMILHADGTLGFYNHFVKNGVLTKVGEHVKRGEPIGLSGNSGYSTTPHLHFAVLEDITSVPFRFHRQPKKLKEGKAYKNRD